ncbi:MAG: hypothetical protein WCA15_08075 [Candidatus Acidiferrales bacterium]
MPPTAIEHPARYARSDFRFDPLVEDLGELLTKIGDLIQSREFEGFQAIF